MDAVEAYSNIFHMRDIQYGNRNSIHSLHCTIHGMQFVSYPSFLVSLSYGEPAAIFIVIVLKVSK